jgi:hypothetical protein
MWRKTLKKKKKKKNDEKNCAQNYIAFAKEEDKHKGKC